MSVFDVGVRSGSYQGSPMRSRLPYWITTLRFRMVSEDLLAAKFSDLIEALKSVPYFLTVRTQDEGNMRTRIIVSENLPP